jgi:hypothetical protein
MYSPNVDFLSKYPTIKIDEEVMSTEEKQKLPNILTLIEENNKLKEMIQIEQEARVKQYRDTMELEIRIKSFEDEVAKNQQERYNLNLDLDRLTNIQSKL